MTTSPRDKKILDQLVSDYSLFKKTIRLEILKMEEKQDNINERLAAIERERSFAK